MLIQRQIAFELINIMDLAALTDEDGGLEVIIAFRDQVLPVAKQVLADQNLSSLWLPAIRALVC